MVIGWAVTRGKVRRKSARSHVSKISPILTTSRPSQSTDFTRLIRQLPNFRSRQRNSARSRGRFECPHLDICNEGGIAGE